LLQTMTSCNKYEDGPLVSLRSRNERVANNWRISKATENGNDVTSEFDRYDLSLTKENKASLTAQYTFLTLEYEYTTEGTWSFTDNDAKLKIDYDNNLADVTYIILKLQEKELWLREANSNLELHLVPN
jgi:hypothetical protein